jgi:hypothetical protein
MMRSAGQTRERTCRYILLPQVEWNRIESRRGLMRHGGYRGGSSLMSSVRGVGSESRHTGLAIPGL